MEDIAETLRHELQQPEFSEGYAESFLDAYIATQIKVLRQKNEWTQTKLAEEIKTAQTVISRIENVNYSAWNIRTLKKLARAFRLRLKVSFETYGSLIEDVESFSRQALDRFPRERDPILLYGRCGRKKLPERAVSLSPGMENAGRQDSLEADAIKAGKLMPINLHFGLGSVQVQSGLFRDNGKMAVHGS
jgi:transcriptional regulator with XRE-family HTH domain